MFNFSANAHFDCLSNAILITQEVTPKTKKSISPGNKKFSKREFFNKDKGKPPNSFPEGEIINIVPPIMELSPRKVSKAIRIFLVVVVFIGIVYFWF